MQQNYISVFLNSSDCVTIAYADSASDDFLSVEINHIAVSLEDAKKIGLELLSIARENGL